DAVPARDAAQDDDRAAEARAPGRRAAQEVQERSAEIERGDDEALPGARSQPAGRPRRLPSAGRPDPDPHGAVLRVPGFREGRAPAPAVPVRAQPQRHPHAPCAVQWLADPLARVPDLSASGGDHDLRAVEDAPAAAAAQPDRAGAPDPADAAHHGLAFAADDRLLRLAGSRGPGAVLVCREPGQYHSAVLRCRMGEPLSEPGWRGAGTGGREQRRGRTEKRRTPAHPEARAAERTEAQEAEKVSKVVGAVG